MYPQFLLIIFIPIHQPSLGSLPMNTVQTFDHSLLVFHVKWWKIKYCSFSFQVLHIQCIRTWTVTPLKTTTTTKVLKTWIFFCLKPRKQVCFLLFLCPLSWLGSLCWSVTWAMDNLILLKYYLTEEYESACCLCLAWSCHLFKVTFVKYAGCM